MGIERWVFASSAAMRLPQARVSVQISCNQGWLPMPNPILPACYTHRNLKGLATVPSVWHCPCITSAFCLGGRDISILWMDMSMYVVCLYYMCIILIDVNFVISTKYHNKVITSCRLWTRWQETEICMWLGSGVQYWVSDFGSVSCAYISNHIYFTCKIT